jgi:cytosine/adenosine deaminase-related metal-dependent hydrolase
MSFCWLQYFIPRLTPEMVQVSTQTAMAELLLSGCTTSSDPTSTPTACGWTTALKQPAGRMRWWPHGAA